MWVKNTFPWLPVDRLWGQGGRWYFATPGASSNDPDQPVIWWGTVERGKESGPLRYECCSFPDVAARDAAYEDFSARL